LSHPELKGSALASDVGQTSDTTVGAVVQGEYLFTPHIGLKLRYDSVMFKPSTGDSTIDGSHARPLFGYYF